MRIGNVLFGLALAVGATVVGVGISPTPVVEALSQGPPVCPAGGQPGDLGCPAADGVISISTDDAFRLDETTSFVREVSIPPCDFVSDADCYNEIYVPRYAECVVMTGAEPSDFRACNRFLDEELRYGDRYEDPARPARPVGCFGKFIETFERGGNATQPDQIWKNLGPSLLPCDILFSTRRRSIPLLEGPTWMRMTTDVRVCDVAGEREIGSGFGCLEDHIESGSTWVRLDAPEASARPVAACTISVDSSIPARLTIVNTSRLEGQATDTLTTSMTWPGGGSSATVAQFSTNTPGEFEVTVSATADSAGVTEVSTCSTTLRAPSLGGEMSVGGAPPGEPGIAGVGVDFEVAVSVEAGRYGLGALTLGAGTLQAGDGAQVIGGSSPSTVGKQVGWLGDPQEFTFRVRTDTSDAVPLVFEIPATDASGSPVEPLRLEGSVQGATITASAPVRLLDTRENGSTIDGLFEAIGVRAADSTTPVQVTGRADIPESATAAAVTLTSVRPNQRGFATLFPCDADRPDTSTLNFTPGGVTGNSATVLLSGDGELCLYTSSPSEFTLDFGGWVGSDPAFRAVVPARLFESRDVATGTVDGVAAGGGRLAAGSTTRIPVAGRGGVSDDAIAVMVNATAIRPSARGYLTLFPCSDEPPNASSLNYPVGRNIANAAMVSLSDAGELCVFTLSEIDFALDVTAVVEESPQFEALVPLRLLDSRSNGETADGQMVGMGPLQADTVTVLPIAGRSGISASARAVTVNVTAIRPEDRGFVTLYPCDAERPTTSSLNFAAGEIRGTSSVIGLDGEAGTLCVYVNKTTDLTIDVSAAFVDPTATPA
jgi:hypothetical protein